jgi:AraC-like DNA-binding protein
MLTNSLHKDSSPLFFKTGLPARNARASWGADENLRRVSHQRTTCGDVKETENRAFASMVEIVPSDSVKRRALSSRGMTVELVEVTRPGKIEFRYRGSAHLLVVSERGARMEAQTYVEGLPQSSLRETAHKLILVPPDHEYRDVQIPRTLPRLLFFYFDPSQMRGESESALSPRIAPRLFFEDGTLWSTALKLKSLIEGPSSENGAYVEALGLVLWHEIMRLSRNVIAMHPARGGLAPWQQRVVTTYIEEHIAEQVSLATLADMVRLSPFYFCRAFKRSFDVSPHQYHINRRIEHAKLLLERPAPSLTEIGLSVGFCDASSFSAAFRKAAGVTPSSYHRSIAS